MSTADRWLEFEVAWKSRLKKNGLNDFHRKDIRLADHPGLLEDLASIIRDSVDRKFSMTVLVDSLHELVPKSDYKKWKLDAYSYAARACAAHVRLWAKENHLASVPEIVFAKGDADQHDLRKRLTLDGFANIQFRPALNEINKKTNFLETAVVPLQAADLFAFEVFNPVREIEKHGTHKTRHDLLGPVWFILDKIPGEPQITSRRNLANFTKDIERSWMPRGIE
jgi:hypothetical protein